MEFGLSRDPWVYFTMLNDTRSPRAIRLDGHRVPYATRTAKPKGPRTSLYFTGKPFPRRFLKVCLQQRGVVASTSGGKAGPPSGGSTTNPGPQETPQLGSPGRSTEHPRPPAWLGPCLPSTELRSPWPITHLQLQQGSVNFGKDQRANITGFAGLLQHRRAAAVMPERPQITYGQTGAAGLQ